MVVDGFKYSFIFIDIYELRCKSQTNNSVTKILELFVKKFLELGYELN
jgi:hypothetical protein